MARDLPFIWEDDSSERWSSKWLVFAAGYLDSCADVNLCNGDVLLCSVTGISIEAYSCQ